MINSDTHRLRVVHVKKFKILKIEVLSEEKPKIEGQEKAQKGWGLMANLLHFHFCNSFRVYPWRAVPSYTQIGQEDLDAKVKVQ